MVFTWYAQHAEPVQRDAGRRHGVGIGGQFRLQLGKRLNTEWYFDYLTSEVGDFAQRNDYHIGWSVMYYPGKHVDFSRLLQPYLILGHCFDYTDVLKKTTGAIMPIA